MLNEISQTWEEILTFPTQQSDLQDWLNVNNSHLGYKNVNDDKIIESVRKKGTNEQEDDEDNVYCSICMVHYKEVEEML